MKNQLETFGDTTAHLAWPNIKNIHVYDKLKEDGKVVETTCGDAIIRCVEAKPFVDFCIKAMENVDEHYLWAVGNYEDTVVWLKKIKEMKGN